MNSVRKNYRDIGTEFAGKLKPEEFGTSEELTQKAEPIRYITDLQGAEKTFDKISADGHLENAAGINARIVRSTKNKIFGGKAIYKSFDKKAHFLAIANADKFYLNAIEKIFTLDPGKDNSGIVERKFLFSPMKYKDRIVPIKFTVLKYDNKDQNLYSIEVIDVDIVK